MSRGIAELLVVYFQISSRGRRSGKEHPDCQRPVPYGYKDETFTSRKMMRLKNVTAHEVNAVFCYSQDAFEAPIALPVAALCLCKESSISEELCGPVDIARSRWFGGTRG